jgi:hypothetical protein
VKLEKLLEESRKVVEEFQRALLEHRKAFEEELKALERRRCKPSSQASSRTSKVR